MDLMLKILWLKEMIHILTKKATILRASYLIKMKRVKNLRREDFKMILKI